MEPMGHCLSRLWHQGTLCFGLHLRTCVCVCVVVVVIVVVVVEGESKGGSEKDIELAHAQAANFLIGN